MKNLSPEQIGKHLNELRAQHPDRERWPLSLLADMLQQQGPPPVKNGLGDPHAVAKPA